VAEVDGKMVPIVDTSAAPPGADRRKHRQVRYQEARLVAAQAHGTLTTRFVATLHDVTDTGLRWAQTAHAAGWALDSQIHALADRAPRSRCTWGATLPRCCCGRSPRTSV